MTTAARGSLRQLDKHSVSEHCVVAYKVHVSDATFELLQQLGGFRCQRRGTIEVKVRHYNVTESSHASSQSVSNDTVCVRA